MVYLQQFTSNGLQVMLIFMEMIITTNISYIKADEILRLMVKTVWKSDKSWLRY